MIPMTKKEKIPPAIFKFVEHELYNYEDTKDELKDLKEDIAESSLGNLDFDDFSSTESYPEGSSTETAVVDILQNKVAKRMSNTIKYIDEAIGELDEEHFEVYILKYRKKTPWQQIVEELPISQPTYFRYRRDIVKKVAEKMGLWQ